MTLSVTEAELIAVCECAQDMIQIKQIVTSLGLKVKTPMKLYVDSHGVVDLVNSSLTRPSVTPPVSPVIHLSDHL